MFEELEGDNRRNAFRKRFKQWFDHYHASRTEKVLARRFHHNTEVKGQWNEEELQYLKDMNLPDFSWNIGAGMVRKAVGISQANSLEPVPVPVGWEDEFARDVVQRLHSAIRKQLRHDTADPSCDKKRTISGESGQHLHLSRDPNNPVRVKLEMRNVRDLEIIWDPESRECDRSDAVGFVWPRWLSKTEFFEEFPDGVKMPDGTEKTAKEAWEDFSGGSMTKDGAWVEQSGESLADELLRDDDYDSVEIDTTATSDLFFDKKKDRIRLLHWEYEKSVKIKWLINATTGQARELTNESASYAKEMRKKQVEARDALGAPDFRPTEVVEVFATQTWWYEIIGDAVVYDDVSPEPYDGWSVEPLVWEIDEADGTTYGLWRNLFGPQRETNRRHVSLIRMLQEQTAPGTDVEIGAMVDEDQFVKATQGRDVVRKFNNGAIAGQQYKDRVPPTVPSGTLVALQEAKDMFDRVGVGTEGINAPAAGAEAFGTVQIRQEWQRLELLAPFDAYKRFQERMALKEVQTVLRSFPAFQIQEMLGDPQQFEVKDGVVTKFKQVPNEQSGQMERKAEGQVNLATLREHQYNIEMESGSGNQALRSAQHGTMMEMHQAGIPVDPDVIFESASSTPSTVERLKKYADNVSEARSRSGQAEEQANAEMKRVATQMTEMETRIKALDLVEKRRHNMATELNARIATWEKADEAEKGRLFQAIVELLAFEESDTAQPQPQAQPQVQPAAQPQQIPQPGPGNGPIRIPLEGATP